MDLWILGQNKGSLVKADAVYIVEDIYEHKKCYFIEGEKYRYAVYKTKERALEIIDEIVQILQMPETYVYKMPEE